MIFALYILTVVPKNFQNLIVNNKQIFDTEELYQSYCKKIQTIFSSKKEFYIPLIIAIISLIYYFYIDGIVRGYTYFESAGENVIVEPELRIFLLIHSLRNMFTYCIMILIVFSAIMVILRTFKCINLLGSNEFPLTIAYSDLKSGAFNSLGNFVISLSIPIILLSTSFSIIGLLVVVFYGSIVNGYSYMILGLVVTIIISFLLYKNTIHIHKAIMDYKKEMKFTILNDIEAIKKIDYNNGSYEKYETMKYMHYFYNNVEKINDWPFDPTSIKKLSLIFLTAVLPLLLSLFGIA